MVSLANVSAVRRQFDEAGAWMDQALLVDPLDVGVNMNAGDHFILRRRYADAVRALQEALRLAPDHRPCKLRLSWALALMGSADDGMRLLDTCGPDGPSDSRWHECAAMVHGAAGDPRAALRHYSALQNMSPCGEVPRWAMARAATAAGLPDEALEHLEVAVRNRSSSVPFLMVTPAFDSLQSDPRFQALGVSLGLSAR
jgi:tetratricopeptide (TPR) repeat protein